MRGFTLDNRFNYRRDGLPINAETAIALDNKERLEVLKGTSGIQAGTSAPGGLVNLVVKRPDGTVRSARVEARQGGGTAAAMDIGERFGNDERFGLRINAAYEDLDPQTRSARGHRCLVAVAADVRLPGGTLVEAEFESSRQQQPSVPGFSLLGDARARCRHDRPAHQPQQPALVATGGARRATPRRCASRMRCRPTGAPACTR